MDESPGRGHDLSAHRGRLLGQGRNVRDLRLKLGAVLAGTELGREPHELLQGEGGDDRLGAGLTSARHGIGGFYTNVAYAVVGLTQCIS